LNINGIKYEELKRYLAEIILDFQTYPQD
jgi:hypothetical protein